MTTNVQEGSAKIYQFPARGRFAMLGPETSTKIGALPTVRAPSISSDSWYHDEAIKAERTGSN